MLFPKALLGLVVCFGFFMTPSCLALAMDSEDWGDIDLPPKTVESLDVGSYLGRWYQMYASLIPNSTFEKYGYCVTGDYYPIEVPAEAAFGITNAQRLYGPKGKLGSVQGFAKPTSSPGKFNVEFNDESVGGRSLHPSSELLDVLHFHHGHYWVVALGPLIPVTGPGEQQQYAWAVVSVPFGLSVFVLARDVTAFREQYQEEVLDMVKKKGFLLPFNKPLETYQADDCDYAPPPPKPKPKPKPKPAPARD